MSLRRLGAVARKEFLHIVRDPRSLLMAIALPVLLFFLFGYALTLDVDRVPLVVWDQSGTPGSRDLVARFSDSRYFTIHGHATGYAEMERALDTREALGALVVPREFDERLGSGRSTEVQLLLDGSDSNTAAIAAGYAEALIAGYSREAASLVIRSLRGAQAATLEREVLELRPRVWFNTELQSRNFIVPGLIAVVIMVISALLTSLTVAREWERGTMEQLISTPVKGPELIGGKLLPYFVIGMFDVLLSVLMTRFLFHVPLRGSVALVICLSGFFVAGGLSMGLLISIVARNQLVATQIAFVTTFLPSFLLSGFIYAIRNMPLPIQVFTHVVPARYFISLLRSVYLKGVGLEILAGEAALLAGFGAAMVTLANLRFRKKLG